MNLELKINQEDIDRDIYQDKIILGYIKKSNPQDYSFQEKTILRIIEPKQQKLPLG